MRSTQLFQIPYSSAAELSSGLLWDKSILSVLTKEPYLQCSALHGQLLFGLKGGSSILVQSSSQHNLIRARALSTAARAIAELFPFPPLLVFFQEFFIYLKPLKHGKSSYVLHTLTALQKNSYLNMLAQQFSIRVSIYCK